MQMKIMLVGAGIGIPKTNVGIGLMNMGYLFFRSSRVDDVSSLCIRDLVSIGQKSGTLFAAGVSTDWFELDPKKDNWAYNTIWLIGKKIEVELSGFQVFRGETDISLKVYDKYNQAKELVNRCCTKARGVQFSSIKIRGVVDRGTLDSQNVKFD